MNNTETLAPTPAIVNEFVECFERGEGRKPTETAIRVASLAYELGLQMGERGHYDREKEREPLPLSSFEAISRSIVASTTPAALKLANVVAKLLYENYMCGYKKGEEYEQNI